VNDDGSFDFEWKATGSQVYNVSASGKLMPAENNTNIGWKGMQVNCSCPNYEEQDLSTTNSGWRTLYVCKHLKAALDSVCDGKAGTSTDRKPAEKKRKQQDSERERLEYGFSKRSNDEIVALMKQGMDSTDGMEALVRLFPADVMPPKQTK